MDFLPLFLEVGGLKIPPDFDALEGISLRGNPEDATVESLREGHGALCNHCFGLVPKM